MPSEQAAPNASRETTQAAASAQAPRAPRTPRSRDRARRGLPGSGARGRIRAAAREVVARYGAVVMLEPAAEIARLWRCGVGVDLETGAAAHAGTLVRLLPAGTPLVLVYRRPARPLRVLICAEALARIRTTGAVGLGEQMARALRAAVLMTQAPLGLDREAAISATPSCVLALLSGSSGAPEDASYRVRYLTDTPAHPLILAHESDHA